MKPYDQYLKLGWALLPCRGKLPATPHGYKDAARSLDKIDITGNIGIATGAISGIFVLDVDVKKNAGGDESLKALEAKHGILPFTVTAKTCSGGKHFYFRYPAGGIGCRTGFLPGLDIRGDGGYVVAPPSVIDGKSYEWINDPSVYVVEEAPGWLLEILKDKKKPATAPGHITENRNSTLTRLGGKMRAASMDETTIYHALAQINADRCFPPLPDAEVKKIAHSVGKYKPNTITEPLTDVWNCERFAEKYGDDIKWCDKLGGWFLWDGTCWRNDDGNILMRWAKDLVKTWLLQAESSDNPELKKHAIRCEAAARLAAMIELVKSEPGILAKLEDFDKDQFLLNCKNGTLNLKTGVLSNPRREDLITRRLEIDYIADASCPTWERFLGEVFLGDTELVDYAQRAVGHCLSGDTREQKFFLCWGNGRNGKSTFLKHLMYILAPGYSATTPAATMLENESTNAMQAIASLKGMRFVILNEFDEGKTLSSAQVKNLTGGEPIAARFLYHEIFTYTPTFKFFMSTNFKPRIKDTSLGIWRRLVLLPFEYTVPADMIDTDLDAKIAAEYEGILAWAVKGFVKWAESGLPAIERLRVAAEAYQQDSDVVGQFLAECADLNAEVQEALVSDFMTELTTWARNNGIKYPPGRAAVIDYMQKRGYGMPVRGTRRANNRRFLWKGIAIKNSQNYGAETGAENGSVSEGWDL